MKRPLAKCGTAACIAGWACILTKQSEVDMQIAARLIGIVGDKSPLFMASCWPMKYLNAWKKAETPTDRARVAVQRIESYIKTKGAE